MTCDSMRSLFSEALYDELDPTTTRELDAHLASCESCREEFAGLRATLAIMDTHTRVELSENEWMEFDRLLDERIKTGDGNPPSQHDRPRPVFRLPSPSLTWGYGIAAAFLLAFGFFVGRTFFTDRSLIGTEGDPDSIETFSSTNVGPSGEAATRGALDYLERSRNLLIGMTNLNERQSGSIDMRRQQAVSRELYDTGNTLAAALNRPEQQQLSQLVRQLQIILLQLSNTGLDDGSPAVEIVRQGLDSRSILLKINLEAIRATLKDAGGGSNDSSKSNL